MKSTECAIEVGNEGAVLEIGGAQEARQCAVALWCNRCH